MVGNIPESAWNEKTIQQDEPESLDIREYLRVVFKHKWGILSVAFLAGLMGLYATYKAVPIYSSKSTLQVERESRPQLGEAMYYGSYQYEFYKTQYELIQSWGVAEMAAEKLGMLDADHLEGEKSHRWSPGLAGVS